MSQENIHHSKSRARFEHACALLLRWRRPRLPTAGHVVSPEDCRNPACWPCVHPLSAVVVISGRSYLLVGAPAGCTSTFVGSAGPSSISGFTGENRMRGMTKKKKQRDGLRKKLRWVVTQWQVGPTYGLGKSTKVNLTRQQKTAPQTTEGVDLHRFSNMRETWFNRVAKIDRSKSASSWFQV